ncbi:hypothetical protein J6590_076478 [Homalodisca vitripennis]|nr:hypothetical protein J6590_076478 [Homalodisca vitripennis]
MPRNSPPTVVHCSPPDTSTPSATPPSDGSTKFGHELTTLRGNLALSQLCVTLLLHLAALQQKSCLSFGSLEVEPASVPGGSGEVMSVTSQSPGVGNGNHGPGGSLDGS